MDLYGKKHLSEALSDAEERAEQGKKRTRHHDYGEEDCYGSIKKNRRLQYEEPFASSRVGNNPSEGLSLGCDDEFTHWMENVLMGCEVPSVQFGSNPSAGSSPLICDSSSSRLPAVEDSDDEFTQLMENEWICSEEPFASSQFRSNQFAETSLTRDWSFSSELPAIEDNDNEFAQWMSEIESLDESNHLDPGSAQGVCGNNESERSAALDLTDSDQTFNLEELIPLATDQPDYEANWKLEGNNDDFAQWMEDLLMAMN